MLNLMLLFCCCCFFTCSFIHSNEYNTVIEHVSTLFQQWIANIYKLTCSGYAYIIYKKVQTYIDSHKGVLINCDSGTVIVNLPKCHCEWWGCFPQTSVIGFAWLNVQFMISAIPTTTKTTPPSVTTSPPAPTSVRTTTSTDTECRDTLPEGISCTDLLVADVCNSQFRDQCRKHCGLCRKWFEPRSFCLPA